MDKGYLETSDLLHHLLSSTIHKSDHLFSSLNVPIETLLNQNSVFKTIEKHKKQLIVSISQKYGSTNNTAKGDPVVHLGDINTIRSNIELESEINLVNDYRCEIDDDFVIATGNTFILKSSAEYDVRIIEDEYNTNIHFETIITHTFLNYYDIKTLATLVALNDTQFRDY